MSKLTIQIYDCGACFEIRTIRGCLKINRHEARELFDALKNSYDFHLTDDCLMTPYPWNIGTWSRDNMPPYENING